MAIVDITRVDFKGHWEIGRPVYDEMKLVTVEKPFGGRSSHFGVPISAFGEQIGIGPDPRGIDPEDLTGDSQPSNQPMSDI